jgi:hypothetical protein
MIIGGNMVVSIGVAVVLLAIGVIVGVGMIKLLVGEIVPWWR